MWMICVGREMWENRGKCGLYVLTGRCGKIGENVDYIRWQGDVGK